MRNGATQMSRGVLAPSGEGERFTLARYAPPENLAGIIDCFWSVKWDLRGLPPHVQETLPFPCVNVVIGSHRPGVHGPATERFAAQLEGEGSVLGAKFHPASFHGMAGISAVDLFGRVVSVTDAFGANGSALDRNVRAAESDEEGIVLLEAFVNAHHPGLDANAEEANRIVDLAREDTTIVRVADLAAHRNKGTRHVERLLRAYVGVSPKWVIRRFRVQEAASRLANGADVDCTALAHELGYFDQAHFIRDFKSQVGKTPAQYSRVAIARA